MKFTRENTLNEILNYPKMTEYFKVLFSDYVMSFFPKGSYDKKLFEVDETATIPGPNPDPFWVITNQLLSAANMVLDLCENKTKVCIPLWHSEKKEWTVDDAKVADVDDVFLVAKVGGYAEERPAVIICPGGGYTDVCFANEGNPIYDRMEEEGYCPFILKYRVAPTHYPKPQEDLVLAIKYVRLHAKEYHIDPNRIMIMGFSAAGHLCGSVAALYKKITENVDEELKIYDEKMVEQYKSISARPDGVCLCYPVISFVHQPHEGSTYQLVGGDQKLREQLSVEKLVNEDFPKTFIWTCKDDDVVPPSNTQIMVDALENYHIPYEVHFYATGGHGCSLAEAKSAKGWSDSLVRFFGNFM